MRISGTILKENTALIAKDWQVNAYICFQLKHMAQCIYVSFLCFAALIDLF